MAGEREPTPPPPMTDVQMLAAALDRLTREVQRLAFAVETSNMGGR